ncbi:MAG: type II toxin-antitoxin system VapC family toxin [Chloroflexota bacterium]|nr:type II toxin-antitoxin system VapC family toxin [Chloroflexota bacterium]
MCRVREELRFQGRRINSRARDMMVAATDLEANLTLVTRNTRDYHDIPGLTLYYEG